MGDTGSREVKSQDDCWAAAYRVPSPHWSRTIEDPRQKLFRKRLEKIVGWIGQAHREFENIEAIIKVQNTRSKMKVTCSDLSNWWGVKNLNCVWTTVFELWAANKYSLLCEILQPRPWNCRGESSACSHIPLCRSHLDVFVCDDFSWENVWKDACHDVNNNCGWRWDLSDCFLFVYLYFSKISNIIVYLSAVQFRWCQWL